MGEDHQVLGVVLRRMVVVAGAGDQPDLGVAGVGVHTLVGEVVLRERVGVVDHEGGLAPVGPLHGEPVAHLQFPEVGEDGRGGGRVDMTGDDRGAPLTRGTHLAYQPTGRGRRSRLELLPAASTASSVNGASTPTISG